VITPTILHSIRGDAGRCQNGGVLDESELFARAGALRGMEVVLPALEGGPPCFLVGGAVRDLLLGREPVDIDVAVEGEAEQVAARLAEVLDGEVTMHERFGTATVTAGGVDAVNLARTRRETYPAPGALPEVEPAGIDEDLGRRDFTINALALRLDAAPGAHGRQSGSSAGALHDPHGGRADLAAGVVRVLHERSFVDDPTRLLRAVRYAARLGFALEAETERWARAAVTAGALGTISGSRIRDELIDLLAEHEAPRSARMLADLGIDRALHPGLSANAELIAAAKLAAAKTEADPTLAALAGLCTGSDDDRAAPSAGTAVAPAGVGERTALAAWVDRLGLPAGDRDRVLRAADGAPALAEELQRAMRPSKLRALLDGEPPEALALALALGAPAAPLLEYVERLSGVRLEIDGADLIAAGLKESPAVGRALAETLARKLDGAVDGPDDELRTALEIARGG
jgi:tRNA nucleotidyltransferase (CCA-adding enzyme)